ncbi:MAG: 50S ribosomal protein L15 [Candidatus Kaiserbacteria bacterium GW2011_GWC2_49_12]|uniref:Large ribosomal subunit protein uL15 n=3 Tax=Candidatus Kaiseribacteriota TaxID=1752734 RepID=A0A0G1WDI2_9BACT|nr:MAG: 50S ribosomal protein L15 [Candidatus Kaiserbacteria bacterium GW2011_GWC2_49_12]KKW16665.1 MAG: 50S ribosomal protein L15 [Candidatus Kaiserbacteria bacterium GW2011_GWB1_50_17]OGG87963.1 MAG: hypothetical protein A3H15_02845 [Candidatus Kaiserbacteria bacterium RIFCSPLOWO2_12_FULL_50_28]
MTGLHTLKRMTMRSKKRVGRGQSSGRGKTSGRGTKGQNARAGRKKRPEMRDIIKKIPKRRGFGKNRGRSVVGDRSRAIPVSLARIEPFFTAGEEITSALLAERLHLRTHGKKPFVKVIGGGVLSKKLSFKGVTVSASTRIVIENAGGSII